MKKYLIIILILIFLGGSVFLPRDFGSGKPTVSTQEVLFQVEAGEGSKEIGSNLEKQGLIWWGPIFQLYVLTLGMADKLQAGSYLLSPSMNIPQMAGKFASGDIAKEKITIIEGWSLKDIGFYFENKGMFQAEELYDERKEIEGYFFPDTYEIKIGAGLDEIIQKAVDNFNKKTAGLEITPEIVIMASLLEKEVKTKEEKELAADVLWKRLKVGMPLQVDSEMWTYENYGLPPKPICNPGLDSILATLYPKDSPYWYYLAKPDGETIFQKTLEEHNIAKHNYLK